MSTANYELVKSGSLVDEKLCSVTLFCSQVWFRERNYQGSVNGSESAIMAHQERSTRTIVT